MAMEGKFQVTERARVGFEAKRRGWEVEAPIEGTISPENDRRDVDC